jgi:adenosylhomocysteine nucleosidase
MLTGIIGAMPEEINEVIQLLTDRREISHGMRTYHSGLLNGHPVVVVFSRWGKVAAAATVATLIHEFGVQQLLFTGVAGALAPQVKVGDIVIAQRLIQHDMDARPLMPRFEIPLLAQSWFATHFPLSERAARAAGAVLEPSQLQQWVSSASLQRFGVSSPVVHRGAIASGDRFVAGHTDRQSLLNALPELLCVEMEGAAVAQVCFENKIPFTVIRLISDGADEHAHIDFPAFVQAIAGPFAAAFLQQLFSKH